MKKTFLIALLAVFTLSSCGKTVMFWNWNDVIGLFIVGLCIVVAIGLFLAAWIQDKWRRFRKKKK